MASFEFYSRLIKRFVPPFGPDPYKATPIHRLIAVGAGSELCHVQRSEDNKDPEYWYLSDKGVRAVIGQTGMLISVEHLAESGLEMEIHRNNAYGNFFDAKHNPLEGQQLNEAIGRIYDEIRAMSFEKEWERARFTWDADRLISRFEDYKSMYGSNDIIPEYTDTMNLIKISEGCARRCIYCPEPGPGAMVPYSEEAIRQEIALSRELQKKYHSGFEAIMNEGFLNTTDLLQFHLKGWTDPIQIVGLFRQSFPELEKTYSFVGVPSVNKTSIEYLKLLFNRAEGLNRVIVGIESADDATSRFLGKNESYSDKLEALMKLKQAGFKVKPIVQVGTVGEGFYTPEGDYVDSRQGLEATARLIAEFICPSRLTNNPDKVLVSKYTPIDGTPLKRFHQEGRVVVPYTNNKSIEDDTRFFLEELSKRGVSITSSVELDYESALEGRVRNHA